MIRVGWDMRAGCGTPLQAHQDLFVRGQVVVDRIQLLAAVGLDDDADRDVLSGAAGAGAQAVFTSSCRSGGG